MIGLHGKRRQPLRCNYIEQEHARRRDDSRHGRQEGTATVVGRQEHSETFAQAEAGPVRVGFGGGERDPQGVGNLGQGQPFDVVQDEDGPVVGRELVDGRGEDVAQLALKRGVVDLRRPVPARVAVMVTVVEDGTHLVE